MARLRAVLPALFVIFCAVFANAAVNTPSTPYDGTTTLNLGKCPITVNGNTYERYCITGEGPQWREIDGKAGVWIPKDHKFFRVTYVNNLDEVTSIHQHGLTPPLALDGVAYVSQPPIPSGRAQTVAFELIRPHNTGTYFMHSHVGFQHDLGLSTFLVVEGDMPTDYPEASEIDEARNVMMYLEDFCGYATKIGPTQNAMCDNHEDLYHTIQETWESMQPWNMTECKVPPLVPKRDTDFKYHLCNSRTMEDPLVIRLTANELVRLRIVNSASFSEYKVDFGTLDSTVIAVDGQPIVPYPVGHKFMEVGERTDVTFRAPAEAGTYPVIAYVDDLMKSGIIFIVGDGEAPAVGEYYMNRKAENSTEFLAEHPIDFVVQELEMRAWTPLPSKPVDRMFYLNLTGNNGFMSINGYSYQFPPHVEQAYPNPYPLVVRQGERVCIQLTNYNPFPHPMHLHGHSFQVVEMDGTEFTGPFRDTVTTPLGQCKTMTFCFETDNPGAWPFHCHKSIHMSAGMLTTIEYEGGGSLPEYNGEEPTEEDETDNDDDDDNSDFIAAETAAVFFGLLSFILIIVVIALSMHIRKLKNAGAYAHVEEGHELTRH
eukprot:TRINITY_DN13018_c0_g1::TRINITY_DN13018_c0_g1_i1::g.11122::m.11122 TRINITY_DN13018_c0_g1::TRINITY_DN13018_c0_g1_i1::g.11122  ORF type:complete len:611 (-),score=140.70,sp/I6WZK7/MMCO_MYCTU/26.58/1e-26,Cu-oxidase_2/PF07731.9/69,Cu-oxidase_2/PF07731.9/0.22,Cu-oxidase_2/PF07731.9/2.5e-24,Cu-oxidase_3/PF07732.10/1.4e-14,Cu-oxidase_3/PF07732.10/6.9e+02,Cu-oxidase_3/PF07732.10/8.7e-05,Cu-oxidase/PF00394.17/6.3e-10,Cu-oxidase/PF00394.17/0.00024 TRINITY_DN13018_c0_g1_i1:32-1825(-)